MSRFTINLNDATTATLDEWAARIGQSRATMVETAVGWYLYALANPPTPDALVQSAPTAGANYTTSEQTYEPPRLGRTTGKPKRDYMATDSDEIRALIDEYNSLPDPFATADEDVMLIRSKTAAEVWKRVQRLRHPELTAAK